MVVVSAAAHMTIVAGIIVLAPYARLRPLPMMAYTVELTDARALGGRLPPGPPTGELGGPQKSAAPEPKPEPKPKPEAKPPEPPKPAPAARPPEPPAPRAEAKPAAKAPATKPPAA